MKTSFIGILSGIALVTSGGVLSLSNPASAAQLWNWSYSAPGVIGGSGTFITNDGPKPFLITDIAGTSEGNTIRGLIAPGGFLGNDNLLTNPTPSPLQLTFNGVSFSVFNSSQQFNLRASSISIGFPPRSYLFIPDDPNSAQRVTFTTTFVSTIPEPSNLLGFITLGGLMLGSAIKRAIK